MVSGGGHVPGAWQQGYVAAGYYAAGESKMETGVFLAHSFVDLMA